MGEFANYRGEEIKIGTCELMYYLRYEDRHLVEWIRGNVDAAKDTGLFWRLPFPDEDGNGPGRYDDYLRGIKLRRENEWLRMPELAQWRGSVRMTHACGYAVWVPCYHGERLPASEGDLEIEWQNGSAGCGYELRHVKNTAEGVKPVVACPHCRQMWSCEWADVLDWIPDLELRARLEKHATAAAVA